MVTLTMDSISENYSRLSLPRDEYQSKYGHHRLSEEEVLQITAMQREDMVQLNQLREFLQISAIAIPFLFLLGIYKDGEWTAPFDGLTLLVVNLLLFSFHWVPLWLIQDFEGGHNATIDSRLKISIALLITQPIFFFLAYRWNNAEISRNLHQQKWISAFALSLTLITGLLAFVIGIGILITPDLSGNIT